MTDKVKIKAIIKQYADKGERLLEEAYENGEHASTTGYWDGYGDCANLLLRELDDMQEEPVSEDLEQAIDTYLATYFGSEKKKQEWPFLKKMAIHFSEWQKEQLLAKAFDFTKEHNIACVLASECLRNHGWFSRERDFNDLFRHLSCVDKLFEGKFSGKTKVIVIKED